MKNAFEVNEICWLVQKPLLRAPSGRETTSRKDDTAIVIKGKTTTVGQTIIVATDTDGSHREMIVDFVEAYPVMTRGEDCFDANSYEPGANNHQTMYQPGVNCFKTEKEALAARDVLREIGYGEHTLETCVYITDSHHNRITPSAMAERMEAKAGIRPSFESTWEIVKFPLFKEATVDFTYAAEENKPHNRGSYIDSDEATGIIENGILTMDV